MKKKSFTHFALQKCCQTRRVLLTMPMGGMCVKPRVIRRPEENGFSLSRRFQRTNGLSRSWMVATTGSVAEATSGYSGDWGWNGKMASLRTSCTRLLRGRIYSLLGERWSREAQQALVETSSPWETASGPRRSLEMGTAAPTSSVWRFCHRIVLLNHEWPRNEGFTKDYSLRRPVTENLRIARTTFVSTLQRKIRISGGIEPKPKCFLSSSQQAYVESFNSLWRIHS